jgi:hypothetical protein
MAVAVMLASPASGRSSLHSQPVHGQLARGSGGRQVPAAVWKPHLNLNDAGRLLPPMKTGTGARVWLVRGRGFPLSAICRFDEGPSMQEVLH